MAVRDEGGASREFGDRGLRRRTIIGAAAWAAPAIVMVAASPAYAASKATGRILPERYPAAMQTGQVTPVIGRLEPALPGIVSIAVSPAGALDMPSTVEAGPDGSFSFLVRMSAVGPAVTVALASPGYEAFGFSVYRVGGLVGTIELTSTPGELIEGAQGTATGRLVTPDGSQRPSVVELWSSATSVATVPAEVAVAPDGSFAFPVTAVAGGGQATITVMAARHAASEFGVNPTPAPVPGTITLTSNAEVNSILGPSMLDQSATFTATVKTAAGAVMAGQPVTFTAPAGTRFASGATATGATDAKGQFTVTIYREAAGTPASKVNVEASSGGVSATKSLIIIGPEVAISFEVPEVKAAQRWAFGPVAQLGRLWLKVPDRPVPGADGFITTIPTQLPAGRWLKPATTLYWGSGAPGGGGKLSQVLDVPVPAGRWTFVFRNTTGAPHSFTVARSEMDPATSSWLPPAQSFQATV